ncbi:hypothetical protein COU17_01240 [Candidatus Kaiserbacteria bacterium CG10_big_fil_rev_8_21_14_0_10_49_17]|uniref:Uncharacterized protein n=1 Tax=Candidatus Kaiserbacteria bacterium CG10_big_fil_rev_8_21_14_0_10_49_17 TaxID=1974609 RepID=A0A2M6WER4_9BACT|nr:MAG: hypothetical protein COU17_01240 [Candidatus Kaiserbacteria bacterium CG10_big_fil_rev_8_21_14_0_10_49_17]
MFPDIVKRRVQKILKHYPQYEEFLTPGPNKSIHPLYIAETRTFAAVAGLYRIDMVARLALCRVLLLEEAAPDLQNTTIQRGLSLILEDAFTTKDLSAVWTKIPPHMPETVLSHRLFGFHSVTNRTYQLYEGDGEMTTLEATATRYRHATARIKELQPDSMSG